MPSQGIDFWWITFIGTGGLLLLVLGLVVTLFLHQRVTVRLQKEKLDAITRSEQKYSDLFNTVSDIVYVHSPDGRIMQINRSVESVLGYSDRTLCGCLITDFLVPSDRAKFVEYTASLIRASGSTVSGIATVLAADGKSLRLLEYRSTPVMEDGKIVAVRGIARNVTEQVNAERSLRKSHRKTERLLDESNQMQEMLGRLSRGTIRMQEEERAAISRELHDEVGQLLATISVNLQIVKRDLEKGTETLRVLRKLDTAQTSVGNAHSRIRRFLSGLRPVELDDIGLSSALAMLTEDFSEQSGIRLQYSENRAMEDLSNEQKIVLFRVVQESLSNIIKHAGATKVSISITRSGGCILAEISDDGCGFDYNGYLQLRNGQLSDRRLGLLGMTERVKLAHGECSIISKPGNGTRIIVRIPIRKNGVKEQVNGRA